jgi:PAS domain S-box-containing protein
LNHNGKSKPIDDLESLKLYELQTKNTISIGEKKWGLTLYATPEYITENLSIVSWGILTASLLFATLLELFLLLLTGRTILFRNMAQELSNEVERSKILEEDLKRTNEDLENRVVERTQSLSEKNRELKKAEEKFKGYLELASDGIHILDENGNVVECSRSFAESIGYSYEEALRLNIKEWDATISPDQPISPAIKEMIASPSTFETTHKRKDGTLFDVQISAKGIEMEGEYYLYASSRDITESKRIKEQLIQAKEQADQANLSKSHFLANMSHEIRTPMNAILGFVDLLAKGEKDPKRLKKFDIVKSSGQTLLNIINDILDFSKIESGQMDIEAHPYFLQEFYDEAETLFAELMHQKQITYHSTIAENVPSCIVTDQVRLKQVVFNLLSNAIKFTPERGKISLDLTYTDKKLTLSVTDTGIGIAPENLDKIFNAFVQEDGSITRKYGGTGLGLSIASRLIKKMGGELKVESTLGEGSRFFFEIPVVACETENTLKEKPHNLQNEDAAQTGLTGHALMVEDNRTNQMLLGFILDDTGITYDIANNGVEAINMFNQNRYDIILMDENMPEMNGIEATKHIRNLEKETGKHIPIIAVTANALDGDRQRFIDAGADGYISKPYAAEDIVELVQKFL